ncbi:unnamed protein product, partial [Owenia fusiformis]
MYKLAVAAFSSRYPNNKGHADVTVYITRNLNGPKFPDGGFKAKVGETIPNGDHVTTVTATDDDNDLLYYTLEGDSNCTEYFYIDSSTGKVNLKKLLTETTILQFQCVIRANDQAVPNSKSADTPLIIDVDRTFKGPSFTVDYTTRNVSETTPVGQLVAVPEITSTGGHKFEMVGYYPGDVFFEIHPNTGAITVKKSLLEDSLKTVKYELRVAVYYVDFPYYKSYTTIGINCLRNQNGPQFPTGVVYRVTIEDDKPTGEEVITVTATDNDDSDSLIYTITGDATAREFFLIDPLSGEIQLKKTVRYDESLTYELAVSAADPQDRYGSTTVYVDVNRDSRPPLFIGNYFGNVAENDPIGYSVVTVAAIDPDLKGDQVYELTGIFPANIFFGINRTSGTIYIRNDLKGDWMKRSTYTALIEAYDTHYPETKAKKNVTITVRRNPNGPEFSQLAYNKTIAETYSVGNSVLQVAATDDDGDTLTYTIEGATNDGKNYFSLNPQSGILFLTNTLLHTATMRYDFKVQASDKQVPERKLLVPVVVFISRDLQPPVFQGTPYVFNVPENHPVDTEPFDGVLAQDPDGTGEMRYRLKGIAPATDFFRIDPNTGKLYVIKPLDTETTPTYTLNVGASNTANPKVEIDTIVTINVIRNVHKPIFSPPERNVTVDDGTPEGEPIVTVTATDADLPGPKNTIRYEVVGDPKSEEYFFAKPTTGEIVIIKDLATDPDFNTKYTVLVEAKDNGYPAQSSTATLYVYVNRNTEPPSFLGVDGYDKRVPNNWPIGKKIVQVSATDRDGEGDNIKVTFLVNGKGAERFQITPDTGFISLHSSLVPDQITADRKYEILVEAKDSGVPSLTSSVTVTITAYPNNKLPVFVPKDEYDVTIPEDTKPGTTVENVTAIDDDCPVAYEIAGDGQAPNFFIINPDTGVVKLNASLEGDYNEMYSIRVIAYDSCDPRQTNVALVKVHVERNKNKPKFTNANVNVTILETYPLGKNVTQLFATDKDPGVNGEITYHLINTNGVEDYFYINPKTGVIVVTTPLTQEPQKNRQYVLNVQAMDGGRPPKSAPAQVVVNVLRNKNGPTFTTPAKTVNISESKQVDQSILELDATDIDGDSITYELTGDSPGLYYFKIDPGTGILSLKRPLFGGILTQYVLDVTATDSGKPPLSATTTITVNVERNPNGPKFGEAKYSKTIPEYFPPIVETVIQPEAEDLDGDSGPGEITYTLEPVDGDDDVLDFFVVGPKTGEVFVAKSLTSDPQKRPKYVFDIFATDNGLPKQQGRSRITITVLRNSNAPQFVNTTYTALVDEREIPGFVVVGVEATDADAELQPNSPNSQIVYSIDPNNVKANQYFAIQPQLGNVYIKKQLIEDPNTRQYQFLVMASDSGIPSLSTTASVTINVERHERNTDSLELGFSLENYYVRVYEELTINTTIRELNVINQATDKNVVCEIDEGNDEGHFAVISTNFKKDCAIVNRNELDRETTSRYNLTVSVKEVSQKRAASYAITYVIIDVLDLNDEAPQWVFPDPQPYPSPSTTSGKYFTALSKTADASTFIIQVL